MTSTSRRSRARALLPLAATALLVSVTLSRAEAPPSSGVVPEDRHAAASSEVVFMGYNLKNYLRMERRVDGVLQKNAPKPEPEIAAILTMVLKGQPDVLGLVEIGTIDDVRDLQERLKKRGLNLPHATINRAFDTDRRTALISRFPITETNHQTKLTYRMGQRQWAHRRGILDATVEIHPDYTLRVLGVHLKSKRKLLEADEALMRRHEAHLTREYVITILSENPETNLILFGDFNDTRNETPIKAIQGKYGTEGYLEALPAEDALGYTWTYHWSLADQYSRFDYLFVNRGLRPEIATNKSLIVSDPAWFTASDHRPVTTIILAADQ